MVRSLADRTFQLRCPARLRRARAARRCAAVVVVTALTLALVLGATGAARERAGGGAPPRRASEPAVSAAPRAWACGYVFSNSESERIFFEFLIFLHVTSF